MEILEVKTIINGINNSIYVLNHSLDTTEETISIIQN